MDEEAKKTALRKITYGLYVLSAKGDEHAAGTVNWLSQASFEPPLVMVGVKEDSGVFDALSAGGGFAVNVVGADQQDVAAAFFGPSSVEEGQINGYPFEEGETGSPVLDDAGAYFECEEVDRIERGDHAVVVGEVVAAGVRDEDVDPLVMWDTDWTYGG